MKQDDEGIRFHTLLTAGVHRGGRIFPQKRAAAVLFVTVPGWRHFCSWRRRWALGAVQEEAAREKGMVQGEGHGCRAGHEAGLGVERREGRRCSWL
jgi:hypothetical protein